MARRAFSTEAELPSTGEWAPLDPGRQCRAHEPLIDALEEVSGSSTTSRAPGEAFRPASGRLTEKW